MDPEDIRENISLFKLMQSMPMDKTIYQASLTFSSVCLSITAIAAIFILFVLYSSRSRYPSIYRRYIHIFIYFNLFDAIIYKLTYVNLIVWHNSIVFFADGFFNGPRAVGVHMVFSSLPTALLCLLNLYKYADLTKSSRLEFLSTPHCIPFVAFWLGTSIAIHYGVTVMLFQTDADSIDQTADLFSWVTDTFIDPKWKPIVGLAIFHLALPLVFIYNFILSGMIRFAQKSQRHHSGKSYKYMINPRHLLMFWIQFAITLFCIVLPRLILSSLPFFYDCDGLTGSYWGQQLVSRWAMFAVPLRPILSILAVLIIVKDIRRHLRGCFRKRASSSGGSMISINAVVI
ncbi:hypothetical protein PRIPAC_73754 [Pristionchus pacificus]|uniref:Uncharacterized protein n=1 Tax=Pristionchus pacificus TaxID=54126 RepID=A0A2A6C6Z7_PRIPA|nr:hypothetical protein PRIPAC_73754 [Pristionchus pacificus]|eukprot:PDM73954.1 hypothetical protein PRIPAC_41310 [Pristionchus pacificus]